MACGCTKAASNRQVTSVKQVIRKPGKAVPSARPQRKISAKRIIIKRPM